MAEGSVQQWRRFVVVGDSCAEGLDDRYPDSDVYRGWADLVAFRLAELHGEIEYANLAVRGKRLDQIIGEQLPKVPGLRPDLVALFGGVNDLLQRGGGRTTLAGRVDAAVGGLRELCPTVVVFTVGDISRQTPLLRGLRGRLARLNDEIRRAAERHDAVLVDLAVLETEQDLRYFGPDRLHLAEHGHRRLAAHVLRELGMAADPSWLAALPGRPRLPTLTSHAEWVWQQVLPTVCSRARNVLVRRSPGDGFSAKRPVLQPVRSA